jgi:hypothetical protein
VIKILVNGQLDAQFVFLIYLFQSSTCFEQPRALHQQNQLYQYNVWYMSLCVKWLSGMQVDRPATYRVHCTTSCSAQSNAPEDGQNNCPKHVELTRIINKQLLLHLVVCLLHYLDLCKYPVPDFTKTGEKCGKYG